MALSLLADENITAATVQKLRERGHDVLWVLEDAPRSPDEQVLDWAGTSGRILLTFDKDFGDLVYRERVSFEGGIVLFRLSGLKAQAEAEFVADVLGRREDWQGHFSVVTPQSLRMAPLPRS